MYHEFYGLKQAPFKITPDTRLFFSGGKRGEILEALVYAISSGEGIVKVVGEVGSGKTMLCRMLEVRLSSAVEIVYLPNPSLTPEDILHAIALELGIRVEPSANRIHVMQALHRHLLERHSTNKRIVVFVEEAQSMPLETLEEIRLLSNLETQRDKLLQIVLFGQPELDRNLNKKEIRQLRERITHSFNLPPLSGGDIREYVQFRLRAVGYRGPDVFDSKAYKAIAHASEGLTRRVNILADKCLLASFAENTHNVTLRQANKAIHDSELGKADLRLGRKLAIAASVLVVIALGYGVVKDNFQIARNLAAWANNQLNPTSIAGGPAEQTVTSVAQISQPSESSLVTENVDLQGSDASIGSKATDNTSGASQVETTTIADSQQKSPQVEQPAGSVSGVLADTASVDQGVKASLDTGATADGSLMVSKSANSQTASVLVTGQELTTAVAETSQAVVETMSADDQTNASGAAVQLASVSENVKQDTSNTRSEEPVVNSDSTSQAGATTSSSAQTTIDAIKTPSSHGANATETQTVAFASDDNSTTVVTGVSNEMSATVMTASRLPIPKAKVMPSAAVLEGSVAAFGMGLLDERMAATQDWLKTTNHEHYTIQLLATHVADVDSLLELLRRWNRAGRLNEVYVYRTRVGEADWFGVLFSDFESFSEAREALKELPRDIQQAKPFVRNVSDISKLG